MLCGCGQGVFILAAGDAIPSHGQTTATHRTHARTFACIPALPPLPFTHTTALSETFYNCETSCETFMRHTGRQFPIWGVCSLVHGLVPDRIVVA